MEEITIIEFVSLLLVLLFLFFMLLRSDKILQYFFNFIQGLPYYKSRSYLSNRSRKRSF